MSSPKGISRRQFVTGAISTAAVAACVPKIASAALGSQPRFSPRPAADAPAVPKNRVQFLAEPFPLENVRLLNGPFLDAAKANLDFLYSMPEERLVHNFRVNAGLPSAAQPLGGWEAPDVELRGHFTGHYLSACGLGYASLGEQRLKDRGDAIVADLAKCQQALGNGYLSAFPTSFFDRLKAGLGVWAPFYTLHKIMAGCLDMYTYCHNDQALTIAEGMADWTGKWASGLNDDLMQRALKTEWGGMNESLYNLYAITGNKQYFDTGRRFEKPSFFGPLAAHRDELKGLHVNTHIPEVIGAARLYELTGDPYYHEVASYFWHEVTTERSYATGGTSNGEDWDTDPGDLSKALSLWSEECCCEYNTLKLTRHLYQWSADPRYMDYYERTLFNARMGTQDPAGMKMYYTPMQTGFWRFFNSRFNSFWCCTGTGAEEFAKLSDSIYFRNKQDVFVNLFIPSEAHWPEKGLTIHQETRFPDREEAAFLIKATQPFDGAINIRIPSWIGDGAYLALNDEALPAFSNPGSYLQIRRKWADGDRLLVKLPMQLRTEALPGDASQRAVMYGPLVLAGRLGATGLTKEMQYDHEQGPTDLAPPRAIPEGSSEIDLPRGEDTRSVAWLKAVEGQPVTFETVGQKSPTTLIPFYRLIGERYAIYWKVNREGGFFMGA